MMLKEKFKSPQDKTKSHETRRHKWQENMNLYKNQRRNQVLWND